MFVILIVVVSQVAYIDRSIHGAETRDSDFFETGELLTEQPAFVQFGYRGILNNGTTEG